MSSDDIEPSVGPGFSHSEVGLNETMSLRLY